MDGKGVEQAGSAVHRACQMAPDAGMPGRRLQVHSWAAGAVHHLLLGPVEEAVAARVAPGGQAAASVSPTWAPTLTVGASTRVCRARKRGCQRWSACGVPSALHGC